VSAEAFAQALPQHQSASAIELAGTVHSGKVQAVRRPASSKPRRWPILAASLAMLAGIATATVILMVQRGDRAPVPAERKDPVPATTQSPPPASVVESGHLVANTDPQGATVIVDNKPIGVTPVTTAQTPGAHQVRIELAGYLPEDSEQQITANGRTYLKIVLKPAPVVKVDKVDKSKPHKLTKPGATITTTGGGLTKKLEPEPDKSDKPDKPDKPDKTIDRPPPPTPIKDPPLTKPERVTPGTKPNPY
jgi:hypothetical protein